ncbi:DUF6232 family protein [Azospirillum sp. sgz301742]
MEDTIYSDRTVTITPSLVVIDGTTYAVSTINSVKVTAAPSSLTFFKVILAIAGVLAVLFSFAVFNTGGGAAGLVFLIPGILAVLPTVSAMKEPARFILFLATSSGERQALIGEDRGYLFTIRGHVEKAMASAREVKSAPPPPADTKECPRCAETIKAAAKACRFCGYEFEPVLPAQNP